MAIMFFMRKLTHPDCCENILQLINEGNKPRVVDVDSRIISRARSKLGGFARSTYAVGFVAIAGGE